MYSSDCYCSMKSLISYGTKKKSSWSVCRWIWILLQQVATIGNWRRGASLQQIHVESRHWCIGPISIASTGFGMIIVCIGCELGLISRDQAVKLTLETKVCWERELIFLQSEAHTQIFLLTFWMQKLELLTLMIRKSPQLILLSWQLEQCSPETTLRIQK